MGPIGIFVAVELTREQIVGPRTVRKAVCGNGHEFGTVVDFCSTCSSPLKVRDVPLKTDHFEQWALSRGMSAEEAWKKLTSGALDEEEDLQSEGIRYTQFPLNGYAPEASRIGYVMRHVREEDPLGADTWRTTADDVREASEELVALLAEWGIDDVEAPDVEVIILPIGDGDEED